MESNSSNCPCKRKCERHGKCEECIEHHRHHKRYPIPTCERIKLKKANKQEKAKMKQPKNHPEDSAR